MIENDDDRWQIDPIMTRLKMTTIDDKSIAKWQDWKWQWLMTNRSQVMTRLIRGQWLMTKSITKWQEIDRKMTRLTRGQNPN